MQKILFVLPSFSYGGSTTALLSILNSKFASEYCIHIFEMIKGDNRSPVLSQFDIGMNEWTNAFYSNFRTLSSKDKFKAFLLKTFTQTKFKNRIEQWVVRRTINRIEKNNYDCVVAFMEKQATAFCQHFSVDRKIAWIHCDYSKAYPRDDRDLQLYEKYNKIVCVSKSTRDSFLKYYPSLRENTVYIYNLFDSDAIISKSKKAIDDLNFDCKQFTIISVGRISKVKRFDLIPNIASNLCEKGLTFKWYIIGLPYSKDDLQRLREAIDEEDVKDCVVYLGGKSNPYPFFKMADLLVCVSESEACPMIFNEAKLLNLPIVSTDFPSAFEFIDRDKDGRITQIETMADTIADIISEGSKRNAIDSTFDANELNDRILLQLSQLFEESKDIAVV